MIITPLLLPVARTLGINDYHFGLVAIVNIMIGGHHASFRLHDVYHLRHHRLPDHGLFEGSMALYSVPFPCALLITFVPWLITVVPDLIYGPSLVY